MKIVKRIVTCLLVLCLLCGLTACAKPTESSSDWIWAYNQRGAFSDKGYYFMGTGFLRFADITSGVSVCLCSKAGCLHDQEPDHRVSEENCEASLPGLSLATPLFFWEDNLYYIQEDRYGLQVYRRDAAGTGLETVATLGETYIEDQKAVTLLAYAIADGFLYYSADVNGTVRDENSVYVVQWMSNYLGRLNLQNGKEEILLEKSDVHMTLCAVKGNEMLFHTSGVPNADFDDPNYREALLQVPATLQHWDGNTGEVRTLLEKTFQEFPGVSIIDNDKLYYASTADAEYSVNTYDLNTGEQNVVGHDALRHIGKGYALKFDPDKETWHLYDLNTGKELPNALSNEGFIVQTVSDIGFVMKHTVADGSGGHQQVFSYVKYASLANGLQEQDLLNFYSKSITTGNS